MHWLILIQKFSLFSHTFHLQNQKIFPQESGFPFHKNRQIKFKKQTGSKIFPKNLILSLFKWVFNFEMLNFLINYYYYYYFLFLQATDGDEEEKGLKIFSGEGDFHAAAGRWCLCHRGRLMGFFCAFIWFWLMGFFILFILFWFVCKYLLICNEKKFFLDFLWSLAFCNFLVFEFYWFLLTRLLNFV